MKFKPRSMLAVLLLAALAAAGCNKGDKPAADQAAKKTEATAAKGDQIAGLPTEKDQVSYMIGMQMGKSLQPVKDDVDVDVVAKAIKASVAGDKLLLSEEQAQKIAEKFGEKMQAKQIAEMMAKAKKNAADGAAFLAENGKKPNVKTTATGLQYEVITEGKGARPKATDTVSVHYTGWTPDGKMFDSSVVRGEPTSFPLNRVIPGWTEGVQLMKVGDKARFWIPSDLAYGDKPKRPGAPAGPLVFDIELLEIKAASAHPAMPPGHP